MNALLRFSACASGLVLIGAGLTLAQPGWTTELVPDLCELPREWRVLEVEARRTADLDNSQAALLQRIEAKAQVVEELIEQRLTLLEAAARFRDLDNRPPSFHWDSFRAGVPGATDDEKHCHEVLDAMQSLLFGGDACHAASLKAQLEDVLRQHQQQGTLRLPQ
jgi:hypothetical protein